MNLANRSEALEISGAGMNRCFAHFSHYKTGRYEQNRDAPSLVQGVQLWITRTELAADL
jgi:hypothetical protein